MVYNLQDVGRFNQKNKNQVDRSREETRSSWSSSEEALQGNIHKLRLQEREREGGCPNVNDTT